MKEPFSLEELTSLKSITFMERALPVLAFAPGRDIGIRYDTAALNQHLTWAVGAFFQTGSFGDLGEAKEQIGEASGLNLTTRITYLPWHEDHGGRLLHLGLSYMHTFGRKDKDPQIEIRTRPESRLTDDRLVDTGQFSMDSMDEINPEFAIVKGPLSFQAEYINSFVNSGTPGDTDFWGFYLFGSYFLTGEHRNYDRASGTFVGLDPKHYFNLGTEGWGAWELAARFSYIDLNDESIKGGEEFDFTAGMNWYLTKKTRFMFNYILAKVKDRETSPSIDSGFVNILQVRFQIYF
jgi:phosphate-selective porin OprO/OprP